MISAAAARKVRRDAEVQVAARKIEDEADAQRCFRAAQRAGQTAGQWGRAHGVEGRSLRVWQVDLERRLQPTSRARTGSALVELVPRASDTIADQARYVLELGGARVEFGDDVSVATLRRALEALRSC